MSLQKVNWEPDVVYLIQFPRVNFIPSTSPFCLKLETWLRMANIRYETLSNKGTVTSKKGQLPFIELNGEEIDDTHLIIDFLTEHFNKEEIESHLTPEQAATARSMGHLLEYSLRPYILRVRLADKEKMLIGPATESFSTWSRAFVKPIFSWEWSSWATNMLYYHGVGRLNDDEAISIARKDIKALSVYLDQKAFMTGDQPCQLDATAFGQLCQLWYLPEGCETEIKKFVRSETPNLVEYLERMKITYWSDWYDLCNGTEVTYKADHKIEQLV